MTVPYTFGTATTSIPLSNLDANFNTPITLGNTSIYLGNTTTTIGNLTLTNATISSGNVTISNITVTTANVTTANVATLSVTGTATIATANITTGNVTTLTSTSITDSGLTSGRVTFAGASGLLSDNATLTYNGTTLTATTGANFCTTSGSVGIGTSSPARLLSVESTNTASQEISNIFANSLSNSNYVDVLLGKSATTDRTGVIRFQNGTGAGDSSLQLGLYGQSPLALNISYAGNLGLGVTPSAWASQQVVLQNKGGALAAGATNELYLSQNVFFGGSPNADRYVNSTNASSFGQSLGAFTWRTAASGTAGDTISFTTAMTLDASGQLSVGTTSAFARITTSQSPGSAGQVNAQIAMTHAGASTAYFISTIRGAATNEPEGLTFKENATERMRIDSSGNVGIGDTNPSAKLVVGNGTASEYIDVNINGGTSSNYGPTINFQKGGTSFGQIANYGRIQGGASSDFFITSVGANATVFGTQQTERMRIDSIGNLYVGRTSDTDDGGLTLAGDGFIRSNRNGGVCILANRFTSDGQCVVFRRSGTTVGSIDVTTSLTTYNTTSDQRLKTNIVDAPSGNIDDIKVRSFDWIADNSHQEYGMVAQELIEVAPYAVSKPENPDEMMGVDYSKLVPMMIKEIQDLKQRIATLENK